MDEREWIERELAKMPPRSQAWMVETLRLWGLSGVPGPVTCPECGTSFQGTWAYEKGETIETEKDQWCPEGHIFPALWPGWDNYT